MQSKRIIIAAIIVVAGAALAWHFLKSDKGTTQIVAETVKVQKGNLSTVVTATGKIEPIKQVEVGTQVSGVVQKIYVDFNSKVKENQLIAELDKTNLKASLAESQASYNNALNELAYLQKNLDRQETLYQNKVISEADYEEAQYKLFTAKSALVQRESDLNRAKTNLGYADIYSPIAGVVLSRAVDVGQTVAASFSTPTLFTIAQDLRQMQVEADVDEADIGSVKEGQKVTFTVDAFLGQEFEGKVTQVRLNATTTSNVVTYTVVIQAGNPDLKLMPGLTATISIYTMELKDILTLEAKAFTFKPDTALLREYNTLNGGTVTIPATIPTNDETTERQYNLKTVWVKTPTGLKPQQITVGESDGINVQIADGLKEGEEVAFSLQAVKAETSGSLDNTAGKSPFMPTRPKRGK